MNKRIVLSTPTIHEEEMGFVREAFEKNWVTTLGFNCDGFEREMEKYLDEDGEPESNALALTSGTSTIHIAVKLAGIKKGDVVLCSDMTFAATVNPVCYEGGTPVFIDSERDTWNMDPVALEKAFEKYPNAKAVILAHLYGTPAKMDEIIEICQRHNAVLIEDAAEALSATYKGKKCGKLGDYNAFSFNGNKIITTSGGGMLITKDKTARDKALFWATQAKEPAPWYQHEELGYNYRMSNIVAGIGRGQLIHLEEHRDLKEKIYNRYKEGFKDLPVIMNPYLSCTKPNFWISCIYISPETGITAMDIHKKLEAADVESRPIWKPMHMQPLYADSDFISASDTVVNEDIFTNGLCLPSDIKMTEEEQDYVIELVKKCFDAVG